MRKLKVYGVSPDGRHRRIVAAVSQREAARMIGVSLHYLREYGSVTGNISEVALAMSAPFTVFENKLNHRDSDPWLPVVP